ncbi:MAG: ribonuclease III [Synergistaceae bacterium]|nr:ribonuclease III [Synergistaceae bacterium]
MLEKIIKGMADVIPFLQKEKEPELYDNTQKIPKIRNAALTKFQESIGYQFKNLALLTEALTHPSYASFKNLPSNQRLEFLGDAVLELSVSRYLFEKYTSLQEGELTNKRSNLVRNATLATFARQIGIENVLMIGPELRYVKHKNEGLPSSAFACATEAVIGAIYMDSNFATAEKIVLSIVPKLTEIADKSKGSDNPKGELQEYFQQTRRSQPKYELLSQEGDGTNFTFTVQATIDGKVLAKGEGSSIKKAETSAAQNALNKIKK